jgi:hypothetical protein
MKIIIISLLIFFVGCGVTPYHLREISEKPESFVTRQPSSGLSGYDSSLSASWINTYKECIQIQNNISAEIEDRRNLTSRNRTVFLGIGGASGLATSAYGILETNPSAKVVGLLGLLSAASLGTMFGFLTDDEIITTLEARIKTLSDLCTESETELSQLESDIVKLDLLEQDLKYKKGNVYEFKIDPDYVNMQREIIEPQIQRYNKSLWSWRSAARNHIE